MLVYVGADQGWERGKRGSLPRTWLKMSMGLLPFCANLLWGSRGQRYRSMEFIHYGS